MIGFLLQIFVSNTTDVMCHPQCVISGSTDLFFLTPDHLGKVVSTWFLHQKVTIFPFVMSNLERYFKDYVNIILLIKLLPISFLESIGDSYQKQLLPWWWLSGDFFFL